MGLGNGFGLGAGSTLSDADVGVAGGVAELDGSGQVPEAQIPPVSKVLLLFSRDANVGVSGTPVYLEMGGTVSMDATKGFLMTRPGSILGISVMYDCTANSAFPATIEVVKNGVSVLSIAIDVSTVSDDLSARMTPQAPGVDTFVAGDIISVYADGGDPTDSYAFNEVAGTVEIQV